MIVISSLIGYLTIIKYEVLETLFKKKPSWKRLTSSFSMEDKGSHIWAPVPPPLVHVILCAFLTLFFNWSLRPVTFIVISARKFVCILSPIVSFYI